jgi:isopentenyl-diphosphate delta-isomerase
LENNDLSARKTDHIQLAFEAQSRNLDDRFYYEPMINPHPADGVIPPLQVAGKIMRAPVWISSMTGGAQLAGNINRNLALACKNFGLGMGLGSCRSLLESNDYFHDLPFGNILAISRFLPIWELLRWKRC